MNRSKRKNDSSQLPLLLLSVICTGLGLIMCVLFFIGYGDCGNSSSSGNASGNTQAEYVSPTEPEPEPDPVLVKAEEILSQMTTEQKVAQLILVRGDKTAEQDLINYLQQYGAGGVVLFADNFRGKNEQQVISMISSLQSAAGGNLLICVDEEGGTVVRVSSNELLRSRRFKSPQAVFSSGGMDAIAADTREKCEFLKRYGINVNFAPVADVVTSPSGFLYKRSFGKDAQQTAQYVGTVVSIMDECTMGSSIKHFPGYGNSSGDTHNGLVTSDITEQTLWTSDLVPFIKGIESGADSVMVSHTIVNAIDPNNPASLSPTAMNLLRTQLGFDGVIITDGLDMGAITQFCGGADPCVRALTAGADLMCTPQNAEQSYNALLAAVNDGTVSMERLDQSVLRIIIWKIRLGLYI